MTNRPEPTSERPSPSPRPPALDHGVIGNGRILALVSPSSAVEWLCLPRFDSPSVFGRILDAQKGGTFRFLAWGREIQGKMSYLPNTNVLQTHFEMRGCVWEILDFVPRLPEGLGVRIPIEVVRLLRPISGHPRLSVDFDPRPDYARRNPDVFQDEAGIVVQGGAQPLHLSMNIPPAYVLNGTDFVLDRPVFFNLSYGVRGAFATLAGANHALDLTVAGWRAWAKTCSLPPFAPEEVLRSALCLKLHIYHDTGAIIAAATTSIPEALGTARTWDYRYCWLRDAAFVVEALRRLSYLSEGERFIHFLRDVAEAGPLQPLYGIGGERRLAEEPLTHLAGFGGNGHVRVGNSAHSQKQNDLMGEIILCIDTLIRDPRMTYETPWEFFPLIRRLVEEAINAAPLLDTGIWEFRTVLRPHTFSRAMCWVAMCRGAGLARTFGRPDLAVEWERAAARERKTILKQAYNRKGHYFTQALDGEHPDASNLLLPTLGIVSARDPRFVSTVRAYERLLVDRGLMLRYRHPDDLGETTAAFTVCSFWWAEALALTGRLEEAIRLFRRLLHHANHLGLFSEDIDPSTGILLGNFPQAYTHVGLIHAAMTIGELLEAKRGKLLAWSLPGNHPKRRYPPSQDDADQ